MACVVVLDDHGELHAATMNKNGSALKAAQELVKSLGLDDTPGEVFAYTFVPETDDPGAARIIGRGKTVLGQFRLDTHPED